MRTTSSPAMRPGSLVACRWLSLKYAGTVITAFSIGSPKWGSARSLRGLSPIAEASGGGAWRGRGDRGLLDRLAEVGLGALFEGLEHDRRDLRWGDLAVADLDLHDPLARQHLEGEVTELVLHVLVAAAHHALHRVNRGVGTADELAPGRRGEQHD